MKKLLVVFVFTFALFNMVKSNVMAVGNPIILTEKIDNPIGGHNGPSKSPTFVYIYQSNNVFYFKEAFVGCMVSLLYNNVTVFSTVVDENGQVAIPSSLTGVFELQIAVGGAIYWTEILL